MSPASRRRRDGRSGAADDLLPTSSLVSQWLGGGGGGSVPSAALQAKKRHGGGADIATADFLDFRGSVAGGEGHVPAGRRQWLHYDDRGRMTVIPADKRPLISELHLPFRDAMMVNPLVPTPFPPALLIRDCALVLNLGSLRAVVGSDRVFLLSVPDPASEAWAFPDPAGAFERELSARLAGVAEVAPGGAGGSAPPIPPPSAVDAPPSSSSSSLHAAPSGADLLAAGASLAPPPPPAGALPYELRALEAALQASLADLSGEAAAIADRTLPALEALAEGAGVTRGGLERVRSAKLAIKRLEARITGLKRELEELINDDDDMRDMFLGRRKAAAEAAAAAAAAETATEDEDGRASLGSAGTTRSSAADTASPPPSDARRSLSPTGRTFGRGSVGGAAVAGPLERLASLGWAPVPLEPGALSGPGPQPVRAASHHDVAACESMLESYFMQADFLLSRLFVLKERIDDTEDLVGIELDTRRNELVALQLLVTLGTASLSIIATVGSLLGMNLAPLPIEASVAPFYWIVGGSLAGGVGLFAVILAYARNRRLLLIPKVPRD